MVKSWYFSMFEPKSSSFFPHSFWEIIIYYIICRSVQIYHRNISFTALIHANHGSVSKSGWLGNYHISRGRHHMMPPTRKKKVSLALSFRNCFYSHLYIFLSTQNICLLKCNRIRGQSLFGCVIDRSMTVPLVKNKKIKEKKRAIRAVVIVVEGWKNES